MCQRHPRSLSFVTRRLENRSKDRNRFERTTHELIVVCESKNRVHVVILIERSVYRSKDQFANDVAFLISLIERSELGSKEPLQRFSCGLSRNHVYQQCFLFRSEDRKSIESIDSISRKIEGFRSDYRPIALTRNALFKYRSKDRVRFGRTTFLKVTVATSIEIFGY